MTASASERGRGRYGESLSVVVCAYTTDRWADLCDAVDSVRDQVLPGDEILVVIDHDRALLGLAGDRWRADGQVTVLANAHRQGLSGARNTGVEHSSTDIIVFLDDDAIAVPGWLDRMVDGLSEPGALGVAGAPLPSWPRGGRPRWFAPELDWVVGCAYAGLPTTAGDVRNPIGAAMAFRREVFDLAGTFTEGIGRVGTTPLGCEETELSIRLRQVKPDARIVHRPDAVVHHRVTPARATWRYLLRRCYAEGISKAVVARELGRGDSLSSERAYLAMVLPRAFARETVTALRGEPAALGAAAAIGMSVLAAGLGYLRGAATSNVIVREQPADRSSPADRLAAGPLTTTAATGGVPPTMDVVLCTRRRPDSAMRCVESITAARWDPKLGRRPQVLLVDNAPQDLDTAATLRAFAAGLDGVRYLPAERPGASAARNVGLRATTADLVAFTDDDVLVDAGWLEAIAGAFTEPEVVCVTGLVVPHRLETRAQQLFEQYGGFGKGHLPRRFHRGTVDAGPLFPFAAGAFGSGNNVAFRRDWLLGARGYDEALGPGTPTRAGEDLDLFVRVVTSGHVLAYEPGAVVRHDHRDTMDALLEQLHGYGLGLTAMLCAQVRRRPATALAIARRVPSGLRFLLGRQSPKNSGKRVDYPAELLHAELTGMLGGPFVYLASLRRQRGAGWHAGADTEEAACQTARTL